ncbi:MAG: DUF2752 domain-containing protein [Verrucomicrobiae bacterium]|nr:DUF2752 domain-containing protein [Verrucomicrobiae bacterium]
MTAAPPKIPRASPANPASSGLRFAALVLGALAVIIGTLVFFFNPATHGFYPVCQFHRLTGLNCPGCGMTRALYALLHGDLPTALRDNALLVLALPALLARGLWLAAKKSRGHPAADFFPGRTLWVLLIIALVFTLLRNLPAFAFLSPA